jgi:hypothetical protein
MIRIAQPPDAVHFKYGFFSSKIAFSLRFYSQVAQVPVLGGREKRQKRLLFSLLHTVDGSVSYRRYDQA